MCAPQLPEDCAAAEVGRGGARSPLKTSRLKSLRVRHKESGLLKMPGYDALNDLFHLLDPAAYARALTAWLQANSGLLPRSLALDGTGIGDGKCGMIITLCVGEPLSSWFEIYQRNPAKAIQLIFHAAPIQCPLKPNALQNLYSHGFCAFLYVTPPIMFGS